MAIMTADRINDLKARVKAECIRRALTAYTGTDFDYTLAPAPGVLIKQEHRDKIVTPLNAINPDKITKPNGQTLISDAEITRMEAFTTVLEQRVNSDHDGTDCSGSCTGMCYGCRDTCYTTCTGTCTGSCTGCTGSCTGCTDACTSCWNCSGTCQWNGW